MLLLAHGAAVNGWCGKRSPLHTSAARGHVDVCLLLVEAGASLTTVDVAGRCPYEEAVACGQSDPGLLAALRPP